MKISQILNRTLFRSSRLSQVQEAGAGISRRIYCMTLPDKMLICKIRKILNAEPRLLRVERYQLRWLCDVAKDSSEKIDGASAAGCKHWKASQRSAKDLMVWLHLRLDLVLAWCGASGVIRVYWKSWGIRGII